jgi:hypothetical protein
MGSNKMKKGSTAVVKNQQTQKVIKYLKDNNIKPMARGTVISVVECNGEKFYMIQFNLGITLNLPEEAIEDAFGNMFGTGNPFKDIFGDMF